MSPQQKDINGIGEVNRDGNVKGPADLRPQRSSINEGNVAEPNIYETLKIRGPYGPPWPLVTDPVEFSIGSTTVRIEIEDENAKYPLGWVILDDAKVQREAQTSIGTFCEWMGLDTEQVEDLKEQMKQIGSIKPFKVTFAR